MLSHEQIINLVKTGTPPLVENIDDYQLKSVADGGIAEGPCVEIRIGRVFAHETDDFPFLGYDGPGRVPGSVRRVPAFKTIVDYTGERPDDLGYELNLEKGASFLVESIERFNLPNQEGLSIVAKVEPRFSLARAGVLMMHSDADPGYRGRVIVRLVNVGPFAKVSLQVGARIAKVRFINVAGGNPSYVGKFGGVAGGFDERR